jgi:hypothetical protein
MAADTYVAPTPDVGVPEAAPMLATLPAPTFSPPAGALTGPTNVTISDMGLPASGFIYYTTNGTNPNPNSLVYSGPIQVSTGETIRAYASAPGLFNDSPVAAAVYTVTAPPPSDVGVPPLTEPVFSPTSSKQNNDFKVSAGTNNGATICYTLDGVTTPTCNAAGACTGSTLQYNSVSQIEINGSVTNASGTAVVQALSCAAGSAPSAISSQTYTLQVAQPTIQGPAPGALTFAAAAPTVNPTVASATNGATALSTFNSGIGANVSCTNGTPIGGLPAPFALNEAAGAQTIWVVGCKPGYEPSLVETGAFTITLNEPTFSVLAGEGLVYDSPIAVSVDDTANHGTLGGEYACVTTDGSLATCGAAGACGGTGVVATGGAKTVVTFPASVGPRDTAGQVNVNGSVLQAVACTGATDAFTDSGSFSSGAYDLTLDPIKFTPAGGTPIPTVGTLAVTVAQNGTGLPYDFICSTQDPASVANLNCTCDHGTFPNLTKTLAVSVGVSVTSTAESVWAVGCLNPPVAGTDSNNFLPSATATASYQPSTVMAAPTITPGGTINNPVVVQFVNNEAAGAASAYFCYTTDSSAPAYASAAPNVCYAAGSTHGSTICTTSAVLPAASSTLADATAPTVSTTGTIVNAVACDEANVLQASAPGTPVDYTLVVGNPVITTKGAVDFGQAIIITTATQSATIQFSTNGTTPNCTTAFGSITAGATKDSNGLYDATYYAVGGETGALTVVGCKGGYTLSAATDSTTFTYSVAQPVALYSDGATLVPATTGATYDDYLVLTLAEPSATGGVNGLWFCAGSNPGCSLVTNGQCTGAGSTPTAACSVPVAGATANSAGQPAGAPACSVASALTLPDNGISGFPNIVACAPKVAATAAVETSPGNILNYTFTDSQVALTSLASMPGSGSVTFAGTLTNTAPDGDATHTGATGNGIGGLTYICGSSTNTIASLGGQPSSCATFNGTPPAGWTCHASVGTPTEPGDPGPTLTFPDQGENATYAVFDCKDGMTWTTGTFPVTFGAYVHTPTFAMTGATSDFVTGAAGAGENLPVSNGATAYVTFDATNLYVGFSDAALATSDVVQFYIGSKANGTETFDNNANANAVSSSDGRALPANFNALYHVYWKVDNTFTNTSSKWSGTAWVSDGNIASVKYNGAGATFVEFAIPLASLPLVQAGDLHLLGADWTGAADVGAWPAPNADTGPWTAWWGEVLTSGFKPNDATLLNLP